MLVNQMQRDMQSANVLEICGGLLVATSLITPDMVPAIVGVTSFVVLLEPKNLFVTLS
jgi:hypothetical protein